MLQSDVKHTARARCQEHCQARCCRYLTVQIPAPQRECDLDELSWLLAHEHVTVYVAARRWHVEVRTRCRYLTANNLCAIYDSRPKVCRDHSPRECEYLGPPKMTLQFDQMEDFDAWRAKERQARATRRVAKARGK